MKKTIRKKILNKAMKDVINIIKRKLDNNINYFDSYLKNIIMNMDSDYIEILLESINYSLFTGGKRLRPIYGMEIFKLFSDDLERYMPYAISVEMIHTYSLIHDDLPSMDNDDYRRGKKTNHKVYGEDIAILAGDSLLNNAFEIISDSKLLKLKSKQDYEQNLKAINLIGKYSGIRGMIGGQVIDLTSNKSNTDYDRIMELYKRKTSGLFQASILSAGIIGNANRAELDKLERFSLKLGLAYQIQDDLLDKEEDEKINKLTYVSFYGEEKSRKDMVKYTKDCLEILESFEDRDTEFLKNLTKALINRNI